MYEFTKDAMVSNAYLRLKIKNLFIKVLKQINFSQQKRKKSTRYGCPVAKIFNGMNIKYAVASPINLLFYDS
jgi:hypothetical protein